MQTSSFNTEFGYELIAVLPYAYYLHETGQLTETVSNIDTACLYYFSPRHIEVGIKRDVANKTKLNVYDNGNIHKNTLNKNKFAVPDLKTKYKNDRFQFDKEIVIICNRINREWNKRPINYFNIDTLTRLFLLLKDYQIIYINIEGRSELYDHEKPINIGDFKLIRDFKNVINIHDLHRENSDLSFNTLQLMLFANCQKFITLNGGHSILASYFGGENIIYSRKDNLIYSKELHPAVNSFYRWYNVFSNQRVMHVENELQLLNKVKNCYCEKLPVKNVIFKNSGFVSLFRNNVKHLHNLENENINVFADENFEYTKREKCYPIQSDFYLHRIGTDLIVNEHDNVISLIYEKN